MYDYLVFFDLDKTLFDENSKINNEVANALDEIRNNNGLPIIATGRNLFELDETLKDSKINTVIAANGDYGMFEGKEIFTNSIDANLIDNLVDFANENNNSVALYNDKRSGITTHDDPTAFKSFERVHAIVPEVVTKEYWHENPTYMMIVMNENLDNEYMNKFPELTFFRNSPYGIDIVKKDASKSTGINQLIENANLQGIPTYAFGDGNNDIPMLNYVDHAVVMGNGLDEVKKYAEFITTDHTDHGIVNGLKHFDLI
ncbi:Cof-type HAD-IIB family hydrolase [Lactobacillus sp. S2-2]|uniref:Cof-type HAD-IIB family hydrolase n=1 Tax=Lactobacillus sp. S2-2 TaxID=2692917 RepID=UPI001F014BA9|nr:Cof-type HAD-IIB family hydrolase [Lactobacillus sp. S2-2]MCF6515749.1 Cof-type HAD-IIB family hydrolase [Lactobacillus sp. S2-2]